MQMCTCSVTGSGSPLHLSTPEDVSLHLLHGDIRLLGPAHQSSHADRVDGSLGLFDGVHLGGDGSQLLELGKAGAVLFQAVLQSQSIPGQWRRGPARDNWCDHLVREMLIG